MTTARIATSVVLVFLGSVCARTAAAEEPSAARVQTLIDERRPREARTMAEGLLDDLGARGLADSPAAADLFDLILRASRQVPVDTVEALRLVDRAVSLRERLQGPDDAALAATLELAGLLVVWSGAYDEARPLYDRSLSIRERTLGTEHPEVASVLLDIANLLVRQGRFAEAVPFFERALTIREKSLGARHADVATVLHNMGNLRLRMGDYTEARRLYQHSLDIRREVLGPRHIDVGLTLLTMGVLFQETGAYDEARRVLEEAIVICREAQGPDSILLSGALNNLGNVHWSVGEAAKARDAYRQALDIKERVMGPEHPDVVQELNNLAVALRALGEYDAAMPLLERGIRIVESRLGPDHWTLGEPLLNLASLMVLKGRLQEARPLYERSLAIRVARLGRGHPDVAESLVNLAGLDLAEGRRVEALALAVEASDTLLAKIRETLAYLPEKAALDLASSRQQPQAVLFEGLRTAEEDAPAWLAACWNWTLQRKGMVLEEMAARHQTMVQEEDAEARAAWSDLAQARAALGSSWVDGPGASSPAAYQARLREVIARKEAAEERLAGLSVRFRNERTRNRADIDAVRRALHPGESLVEFVRVEVGPPVLDPKPRRDFALILGPDGTAAWEDLGPAKEVDRLVAAWRRELAESYRDMDSAERMTEGMKRLERAGEDLRRAVWDPVVRHLQGAHVIRIVPDGPLHQVEFGALPAPGGRFLAETEPAMQLLDAARDLLARGIDAGAGPAGSERPATRGVLALGAPDFDARGAAPQARSAVLAGLRGGDIPCPPLAKTAWSPLPESAREVQGIERLLRKREPVTLLTGASATVNAFLREASGRRALHLATHGYFLDRCGDNMEDPLLRSGLVFAGANHGGAERDGRWTDNGILTAEEIAGADLHGVEIAVLSACDTGRGDVQVGEGVFGLRRALEIAGVRTIVMSLWPVPDRPTRRWMMEFYRGHALDGATARDAARHASLSLLEGLRDREVPPHPYLWTGFVVAGAAD